MFQQFLVTALNNACLCLLLDSTYNNLLAYMLLYTVFCNFNSIVHLHQSEVNLLYCQLNQKIVTNN